MVEKKRVYMRKILTLMTGVNFSDSDYSLLSNDDSIFEEYVDKNAEWDGTIVEIGEKSDNSVEEDNDGEELDLVLNEDDLASLHRSDEEDRPRFRRFNPKMEMLDPKLETGLIFSNSLELKQARLSDAIKQGRAIKFVKNERRRVRAKCREVGCPWHIFASSTHDVGSLQVRTYQPLHRCPWTFINKNVKTSWLANRYQDHFRVDPKLSTKNLVNIATKELRCQVTRKQGYRAKCRALIDLHGTLADQYNKLWDYAAELRRTNPGTTILMKMVHEAINDEGSVNGARFSRLYICYSACKEGFLEGCRKLIGVDGTFLKGPNGGILLVAVGLDPNNQIYPICFAVVEGESLDSWVWFLGLLREDLKIENDCEWCFVSDKQKGLQSAFDYVFPSCENRFCVRHLHANFKNAGFRGEALKQALWAAAKATTVHEFARRMEDIKKLDGDAFEWLKDKPPSQWSRSHFNTQSKCDVLLNNICESFNAVILEEREQPILVMLESLRNYVMFKRQDNRDRAASRWHGTLCPKIQKKFDMLKQEACEFIASKADATHYQVTGMYGDQFAVDLQNGTCTCRRWELSGIPCKHAISAIWKKGSEPDTYVDQCYSIDTYKKVYEPVIYPLPDQSEWVPTNLSPSLPPNYGRGPGRPAKARRREPDEPRVSRALRQSARRPQKLKRVKYSVKCRGCGGKGHNKRTCPQKASFSEDTGNQGGLDNEHDGLFEQEEEIVLETQASQTCQKTTKSVSKVSGERIVEERVDTIESQTKSTLKRSVVSSPPKTTKKPKVSAPNITKNPKVSAPKTTKSNGEPPKTSKPTKSTSKAHQKNPLQPTKSTPPLDHIAPPPPKGCASAQPPLKSCLKPPKATKSDPPVQPTSAPRPKAPKPNAPPKNAIFTPSIKPSATSVHNKSTSASPHPSTANQSTSTSTVQQVQNMPVMPDIAYLQSRMTNPSSMGILRGIMQSRIRFAKLKDQVKSSTPVRSSQVVGGSTSAPVQVKKEPRMKSAT